jgi:hypothetical protein
MEYQVKYLGEPDHLFTPIKTPSTIEDLRFNSLHCRQRSLIERVNSRLKIFKIFKEWNRKDFELHNQCVKVVCLITNIIFELSPLG